MNKVIQALYEKMQHSLDEIATAPTNELEQAERSREVAGSTLEGLKAYLREHDFKSMEEEIHFFKTVKPGFLREWLYHTERYYLELNRPVGNEKELERYFSRSLDSLQAFFNRNQFLHCYYRTGKTNYDVVFFSRQNEAPEPTPLPEYMPDMDARFSTPYSTKLAQIQAFEKLATYINHQLSVLKNPQPAVAGVGNRYTWTDTKAGLIELIYALQSIGAINHSQADVSQIATLFEQVFQVSLGNFYRTFQEIRIRKKGRTAFLDKMKEMLLKRMDETDDYFR